MKTFLSLLLLVMIFGYGSAEARFLARHAPLDCSTASSSGSYWNPFQLGCDCMQGGWVIGGMIIVDGPVFCGVSFRNNDRCNFDGQCPGSGGGGLGGDISHAAQELTRDEDAG